jgi:acetolactate synthase I/II/III large subunit
VSVKEQSPSQTAAQLLVRSLVKQQVTHIFGIPGGKILPVYDVLNDEGPELVVCRHEQGAAFMAAAIGRLTGRPGVCLVTSGPGTANLATGLLTATTEGDPVVAIGGAVPLVDSLKQTHQSMDSVSMMRSVTKYSVEVRSPHVMGEVVANAFRAAVNPRQGASFIALPSDVAGAQTAMEPPRVLSAPPLGSANEASVQQAAAMIAEARLPVVLAGMGASEPTATAGLRALLAHYRMPVVGTFQGAGAGSRDLLPLFFGRIGLFHNQPGDKLLAKADLVLTVGYDPVEYDPGYWNVGGSREIVHLDNCLCDIDNHYQPAIELRGDIGLSLRALASKLPPKRFVFDPFIAAIQEEWKAQQETEISTDNVLIQPSDFVQKLRALLDDDTTVACDVGSSYIWMARHFFSFEPRKLLFSNGQQTLGVSIPWAIAASIVHPSKKAVAVTGDGAFLYSSMELETAMRLKVNMTIFVLGMAVTTWLAFNN